MEHSALEPWGTPSPTNANSPLPETGVASSPLSLVSGRSKTNAREHALQAIAERNRHLELQNHQLLLKIRLLSRLAYIDALTGLENRRCFDARMSNEVGRAYRNKTPLALALCDVDSFKHYNDTFGHHCGDDVLRKIGEIMCRYGRRGGDMAVRYGGEEFALLLPGTCRREAVRIAERFRDRVAASPMQFGTRQLAARITVSIGVTVYPGAELCAPAEVVRAADIALYQAKKAGRNCTKYQPLEQLFD